MPLISIITPAYNAIEFLSDTVLSVKRQTFADWEMIVVDDCSQDGTYKLACDFAEKDNRIKVIRHKKNYGVAAARNTALDVASGDFIAFLDSDDQWIPCKLERQLDFMRTNGHILTYTSYQLFNSRTKMLGKIIKVPPQITHDEIYGNTIIACLTVMVNRKKSGIFHMPLIAHTEDQCTWQDILSRGYIAYGIQENLAIYRIGNNSLTRNKIHAMKKQWETYREYYNFSVSKSCKYFLSYGINVMRRYWQ